MLQVIKLQVRILQKDFDGTASEFWTLQRRLIQKTLKVSFEHGPWLSATQCGSVLTQGGFNSSIYREKLLITAKKCQKAKEQHCLCEIIILI